MRRTFAQALKNGKFNLRKTHQANDFTVMSTYGFDKNITESECVAELMKIYQELTKEKK